MTSKRSNGAERESMPAFPFAAMWQPTSLSPFMISQRLALEAARFWGRRMHAYADQMQMIAGCTSPDQLASVNVRFIERLKEDYAAEGAAMQELITPHQPDEHKDS